MDKVFGWWWREGQEGQATQRQSTDPPACQGKILSKRFPRDFLAANLMTSRAKIQDLHFIFEPVLLLKDFPEYNRASVSSKRSLKILASEKSENITHKIQKRITFK